MSITRPPDLDSFAELLPWRRPVDAARYRGRADATGHPDACWTVAAYDIMDADDEAAAARGRRARRQERIRRWKLNLGRYLRWWP